MEAAHPQHVLVIGAGPAAARCAETLRAGGFRGAITVVGDERRSPYDRPALSKGVLAGTINPRSLGLRPPGHWRAQGVHLRTSAAVVGVDPERRLAHTRDGVALAWDALVLATGASPRRLSAEPGVHVLRSAADARRLRRGLAAGRRLVVAGGGFLALETASTAAGLGLAVALLAGERLPLAGRLGEEVAALVTARARAAGVDVRRELAAGVRRTDRHTLSVSTAAGAELRCDLVLQAIGCRPAAALLAPHLAAAPDGGVPTDPAGRTDLPGVFACGDVASPWHAELGAWQSRGHWTAAVDGGAAVARAILGLPARPQPPAYCWSDAFGLRLQVVGDAAPDDAIELEADGDGFAAGYRRDGRFVAAVLGNRPVAAAALRRELAAGAATLRMAA